MRVHNQLTLLIHQCTWCALRRVHGDERGDGGERNTTAITGKLEVEARGVVAVQLNCFQLKVEGRCCLLTTHIHSGVSVMVG
jgi:hypothetical protein